MNCKYLCNNLRFNKKLQVLYIEMGTSCPYRILGVFLFSIPSFYIHIKFRILSCVSEDGKLCLYVYIYIYIMFMCDWRFHHNIESVCGWRFLAESNTLSIMWIDMFRLRIFVHWGRPKCADQISQSLHNYSFFSWVNRNQIIGLCYNDKQLIKR